jgi:hypothetical protein
MAIRSAAALQGVPYLPVVRRPREGKRPVVRTEGEDLEMTVSEFASRLRKRGVLSTSPCPVLAARRRHDPSSETNISTPKAESQEPGNLRPARARDWQ